MLLKKFEELNARVSALETENARLREENTQLKTENRLLRQKLDQYIRHYFGGQRNESLDKHQLELLLQGLPNVITLPTPETKTTTATRNGTAHPVRRMLVEDKLETQEVVIEPAEVQAQPDGYAAYESLAKARGDLTLVGCWAHSRRGFHEALAETKLAAWFVRQIGLLYAVEKKFREQKAGPALRQAMRA